MDEKNEHEQMLTVAKIAIEKCLSLKKLKQHELAEIIGYDGPNAQATICNILRGKHKMSGLAVLRVREIIQATSYAIFPVIVVPEYGWLEPIDENESDGSSLFIRRNWFPRMIACATVRAGAALTDLNYDIIGYVKNDDPDIGGMEVYCLHQDLLPRPEWYEKIHADLIQIFVRHMNASAGFTGSPTPKALQA